MRLLFPLVLFAASLSAQSDGCFLETLAGGMPGPVGDGGPAVEAELRFPREAVMGPDGALYIIDSGHRRIRRVLPDGTIERFAGTGEPVYRGDGTPALEAGLVAPRSATFGPDGSLYFLDSAPSFNVTWRAVIRRVTPDGVITTIAGAYPFHGGEGGPAKEAGIGRVNNFTSIAVGPDGSIYVSGGHRIRRITPDGVIRTVAGVDDPNAPRGAFEGDGGPAIEARLNSPGKIVVRDDGVIYFLDNFRLIRRIRPDGVIDTYVAERSEGISSDGTSIPGIDIHPSTNLTLDPQGRLMWNSRNGGVQRIDAEGRVDSVWTNEANSPPVRLAGAGPDGRLFGVDWPNFFQPLHRVVELVGASETRTLAGVETAPPLGDGGPAREASISPGRLAVGPNGEVYVADNSLGRISVIRDGRINWIAGAGFRGRAQTIPDSGLALDAQLRGFEAVAAGPDGSLFVAQSHQVFRIDPQGTISLYAGDGSSECHDPDRNRTSTCGDGGPATEAQIPNVSGLAVTPEGVLYIVSRDERRGFYPTPDIRKVTPDGVVSFLGLNRTEHEAVLGLGVDGDDLLVLQEAFGQQVIRIEPDGNRSSLAAPRTLYSARSVTGDGQGGIYLTGVGLQRLVDGVSVTLVDQAPIGSSGYGPDGPAAQTTVSRLVSQGAAGPDGSVYFIDDSRVRRLVRPEACAPPSLPRVTGVLNAAHGFGWAPGVILSVFGQGIGPEGGQGAVIGAEGRLTTELAGVRVFVDDRPAPLTFVSHGQVNAIIPYETKPTGALEGYGSNLSYMDRRSADLRIEFEGATARLGFLSIAPAAPALFRVNSSSAVALNQDGTLNARDNPATAGSIVVLYGTGEGHTDPPGVDGRIAGDVLPRPVADVAVTVGDQPAEILYFGAAPGLVSGVFQTNVRIPTELRRYGSVEVDVRVGQFDSAGPGARIHVAP